MNDSLMEELIQRVMNRLKDEHLLEASSIDIQTLGLGFTSKEQLFVEHLTAGKVLFVEAIPEDFNGSDIWISHPSVEDLMSLSLGLQSSYGNLISLLLEGKKIKIYWDESMLLNATPFLKNKIKRAMTELTKMGFVFEKLDFKSLHERSNLGQEDVCGDSVFKGKLITEEIVMNLPDSLGKLYVDPSVLITPLAQDMLKAKNIICIKKDCLSTNRRESVDEGR